MAFVSHVPTVMPCLVECVVTYFNEAYSHAHCVLKNFFFCGTPKILFPKTFKFLLLLLNNDGESTEKTNTTFFRRIIYRLFMQPQISNCTSSD